MPKQSLKRLAVSRRAVEQRVNRALAKDSQQLRKCRPDSRMEAEHGAYVMIDTRINRVIDERVDIEAIAREMGALKAFEELAAE